MLQIYHVSTLYRRISLYNVQYCIVGALRRRCFPNGETTGKILSSPTAHRNFHSVIRWHHLRRGGYYPPANVANLWAEPIWPGNLTMLRMFHVSTLYRRISLYNVQYCIVGALRRRCFPNGETTGKILSSPTAHRNFHSVIRWHHLRRGGYYPPANVANFWAEPLHAHRSLNVANIPRFDIVPSNFTV